MSRKREKRGKKKRGEVDKKGDNKERSRKIVEKEENGSEDREVRSELRVES
jgi:hypothetical protein